jgi:hypothetical protein
MDVTIFIAVAEDTSVGSASKHSTTASTTIFTLFTVVLATLTIEFTLSVFPYAVSFVLFTAF